MEIGNDKLGIGIGTRETEILEAKQVIVTHVLIVEVKSKENKPIGEKVVCVCEHPDRKDPLELSKSVFLKNKKIKTSGLWFNLDQDGLIPKESALAILLRKADASNVNKLVGKQLDTDLDENGFLCFKCY